MTTLNTPKKDSEEIEKEATVFGERLGLLLSAADMPEVVKDALAAIIPTLTIEKLDELSLLLESFIPGAQDEALEQFMVSAQQVQKSYEEEMMENHAATLGALDAIKQKMDEAENHS